MTKVNEKWNSDYETPKSKKGMWDGYSLEDLHKAAKTATGKRAKEIDFAIRAKTGWGKVGENVVLEAKDWDSMSPGARDLVLHADNDRHLHDTSHRPIVKNLAKRQANGDYDSDKATKLWGYHADRAAMSCCKTHGGGKQPWHKMFSTTDRKQAAAHWEQHHRDSLQESLVENVYPTSADIAADDSQKSILGMIQAAFEEKPATFAEHFANAVQPKIEDHIEALKDELKKFVFNHSQGNFMEGVNCKSKMLLSAKASKKAWPTGQAPALSVNIHAASAADFAPQGEIGSQHE